MLLLASLSASGRSNARIAAILIHPGVTASCRTGVGTGMVTSHAVPKCNAAFFGPWNKDGPGGQAYSLIQLTAHHVRTGADTQYRYLSVAFDAVVGLLRSCAYEYIVYFPPHHADLS